MIVAREGQQSALETKAFSKLMPPSCNSALVCGMWLRSSLRMSSARMKTMLGLAVSVWASLGLQPDTPKESSTTKATQANGKTIFLIPSTPLEYDEERQVIRPLPRSLQHPKYQGRGRQSTYPRW